MPHKDPSFLQLLYEAITASSTWQGAIMAFIIACLRIVWDGTETRLVRILIEASICGALSLCATSIIDFFSLPANAAITIGGGIGFVGVTALRNMILKFIKRKINDEE